MAYDENESRGPQIIGVESACLCLAVISMALRCFVRIRLIKAFGLDDWLMSVATISFCLYCSFSMTGVRHGTGRHRSVLTEEQNATAKRFWWSCYLTYSTTMMSAKMSIAWFLLRVTVKPIHKWIIYAAVGMTVVSCLAFFFACIFQCWPISYFWDKYTQTGTCVPDTVVIALAFLFSAISIMTDFTFALLPAWIVSHLNMKLKTKIALIVLMGLGCFASTAVVVRLPVLPSIASDDFLYDTADIAIWSAVEQCLAITAGALATLQPLVKLIGYKLGLASHPALPGSSYENMHGGGTISVRRSFTRRTEVGGTRNHDPPEEIGLKLNPDISGYSAMCYNTSQEELRGNTAESDGKSKNSDVTIRV